MHRDKAILRAIILILILYFGPSFYQAVSKSLSAAMDKGMVIETGKVNQ